MEIQKKGERSEEACISGARARGYTPAQVESLRKRARRDMQKEVARLNQEWEEMWCA